MAPQNDNVNNHSVILRRKGLLSALVIVVSIGAGIVWLIVFRGGKATAQDVPTFTTRRGPLTISVVESGSIKARDQHIIKNEVEGRTSIITLVREGTRAKKGDLLVELDASTLQDGKIDQEISVQNTEAAYINAKENLAIVSSQAASDVNQADLALEFARQDLRKYELGQYPKDANEANKRITLAKEELERSEQTLEWSNRLYQEKYLSETERAADELTVKRRRLEFDIAVADLNLLQDFTYPRQIRQLQSDVQQAVSALDRAKRKADADKRQAEADLKAKEAEYTRQQTKLLKIEDQIIKTTILAPCDGLVVYATSAKGGLASMMKEPLAEGQQVFERQELIYMPTDASTMAEVGVHETSLAKVRAGQPAIVTVETLPGKRFLGTVGMVAPLPDSTNMFLNPDLKVFNTQIYIDTDDPELRSGMTCKVEIIVEKYDDVVYVPIQSVTRVAGDAIVYVREGKSVLPRKVEIGLDDNRMIRIISGLEKGEVVLLDPPLKPSTVDAAPAGSAEPNEVGQKTDAIDQQVRDRLDASRQTGPDGTTRAPTGAGTQGTPLMQTQGDPKSTAPKQMPQGATNLSPQQQEQMKKQMQKAMELVKNMSEEEKEKLKNMSMEERMKFFQEKLGDNPQK
ncbi:MAG TPA: efflux RND transporter periplasmic adaptor subunit [Sedimentisphaerales bacterium]|nr:efflux RND transporter periplasmic adaptor subunit [Sedimentisphaerales bacterium]